MEINVHKDLTFRECIFQRRNIKGYETFIGLQPVGRSDLFWRHGCHTLQTMCQFLLMNFFKYTSGESGVFNNATKCIYLAFRQ